MRVLFAGGGTGGHLFPALAIAEEIKRLNKNNEIEFVGTRYGIEYRMREKLGYPLSLISMRGLPRKVSLNLLIFPFRVAWTVIQSIKILRRFKPDIVVGTGGYVAGPPIIAASMKKILCVIQEQNSFPGLVTRKLASHTNMIYLAYRKAEEYLPKRANRMLLGNPVRSSINSGDKNLAYEKFGLRRGRKTILILGGSQGARKINYAVLDGLKFLDDSVQLLWQCGEGDYKDVTERLDKKDFVVSLFPFSKDMELVYAAADIAIARAGALTIAELTACGIPAILIPYPYATANHQDYNAREIKKAGAAEVIADKDIDTVNPLQKAMTILASDKYEKMKSASLELGNVDTARKIALHIADLVQNKGEKLGDYHQG
ncbi:MAG: undecaprenyldiphospho-muramoylpentapeptide beta-N-acetylglucosaminyltransferase [candidate division Zixibacteria bacterium]